VLLEYFDVDDTLGYLVCKQAMCKPVLHFAKRKRWS